MARTPSTMTLGSATDPHRGMSAASSSACIGWVFHILRVFPLQCLPLIQCCWPTILMLPLLHVSRDVTATYFKARLASQMRQVVLLQDIYGMCRAHRLRAARSSQQTQGGLMMTAMARSPAQQAPQQAPTTRCPRRCSATHHCCSRGACLWAAPCWAAAAAASSQASCEDLL